MDVTESADPEGLRVFYYLVQDLKALVFSLISLHFKVSLVQLHHWRNVVSRVAPTTDQAHLRSLSVEETLRKVCRFVVLHLWALLYGGRAGSFECQRTSHGHERFQQGQKTAIED